MIRIIFIDAKNKVVEERYIEPSLKTYYKLLECSMIEAVYPEETIKGNFLYVDEEGLLKEPEFGFQINGFPQEFYAGSAVMLRSDEQGNDIACSLELKSVIKNIKFVNLC